MTVKQTKAKKQINKQKAIIETYSEFLETCIEFKINSKHTVCFNCQNSANYFFATFGSLAFQGSPSRYRQYFLPHTRIPKNYGQA